MEATKMPNKKSRLTLAVVMIAATVVIVGGVAIASNTGFKINKALFPIAANPQAGNNWTSLPYFHPYPNANVLCLAMGLRTNGVGGVTAANAATLLKIDPVSGGSSTGICGTSTGGTFTWAAGTGVRIRNTTAATGPTAPTQAILVGSHNPSVTLNLPQTDPTNANANKGNFWFAVPYHTTAVNAQDLCNSVGLVSSGALGGRGSILRSNAQTGGPTSFICGSTTNNFTLTLGEAVRLRQVGLPVAGLNFTPAHF
jgi:hypothetical protein